MRILPLVSAFVLLFAVDRTRAEVAEQLRRLKGFVETEEAK